MFQLLFVLYVRNHSYKKRSESKTNIYFNYLTCNQITQNKYIVQIINLDDSQVILPLIV